MVPMDASNTLGSLNPLPRLPFVWTAHTVLRRRTDVRGERLPLATSRPLHDSGTTFLPPGQPIACDTCAWSTDELDFLRSLREAGL